MSSSYLTKSARHSISLSVRFAVLQRDFFQCRYCHLRPPEVDLQVDHVEPVSLGGTNDMENLVTACRDCNVGKSDSRLSIDITEPRDAPIIPLSISDLEESVSCSAGIMATRLEQYTPIWAYMELLEQIGLVDHFLDRLKWGPSVERLDRKRTLIWKQWRRLAADMRFRAYEGMESQQLNGALAAQKELERLWQFTLVFPSAWFGVPLGTYPGGTWAEHFPVTHTRIAK